jgi:ribonucleoside-diphosphate reductase beta chain
MPILWKKQVTDWIKLDNEVSVFKQLYTDQKKAIRFPEEINVQLDLVDYKSMTEDELVLFKELVWYFVTSELLVQNVLGESFYPYIVDPRAKMAMTVQMFMEDIHSDFFEMILNTFNMNRDEIYNKSINNPIMQRKQNMVAKAANLISVSNGGVNPDTLEGKKQILNAILVNNIVQEGIFFYSAFALYFAIRETGKMKNICNGIDLVLIDESFHLKLGIELILTILEESPEILEDKQFIDHIKATIVEGTELEIEFIRQQFKTTSIFNITYAEMEQYIKYITDRRLEELWFDPHYMISENPLKFLQKEDLKTLQNFFEITPNQYTNF